MRQNRPDLPSATNKRGETLKDQLMTKTNAETQTLIAANDNPGGATEITVLLSSFVSLMARAHVATGKTDKRESQA